MNVHVHGGPAGINTRVEVPATTVTKNYKLDGIENASLATDH